MNIGTRSLLFGVHQFAIHPLFVAWAWWRLYGFPRDWRLWLCFLVHDWGYWGCADIDGDEGRFHPEWAAEVIGRWLDRDGDESITTSPYTWEAFLLCHSRHCAKQHNIRPSRLCHADKLAICLMPAWLYLTLAWLSGELPEYMANGKTANVRDGGPTDAQVHGLHSNAPRVWLRALKSYMRDWVEMHR